MKIINEAISILLEHPDFHSVTGFFPPLSDVKKRVRVTRVRKSPNSLCVTIGKPNYAERKFLKLCKQAKTKPRRFWFKSFPKKRVV